MVTSQPERKWKSDDQIHYFTTTLVVSPKMARPEVFIDENGAAVPGCGDESGTGRRAKPAAPAHQRRLHADHRDNPDPGIDTNQRAAKRSLTRMRD
jgi:hypothetical protein